MKNICYTSKDTAQIIVSRENQGLEHLMPDLRRDFFMFCASVAYPVQEGGRFDFEYFSTHHIPMFVRFLGNNCVRYEVHKYLASPGAPAPTYLGAAYLWLQSGEAFGAALAQHGDAIYGDIPRFTDIEPVRQWSEVVEAGDN